MLAQYKGKRYKPAMVSSNDHSEDESKADTSARRDSGGSLSYDYDDKTQLTCDVLCSLSSSKKMGSKGDGSDNSTATDNRRRTSRSSPSKQLQLPMFLSKTYHMIDRCDPGIATWSDSGDNFVVKNVEKFAGTVLPLYFKHSNFSSFARQLNFYGFRKLRTDPILTSDVDPQTASYVRFYHEKFQKDRPELLHEIKRATKSDQQSKDEVESLKQEIYKLREMMSETQSHYDQKLSELSYECNRKISAMNAEYDKLAALVHSVLNNNSTATVSTVATTPPMAAVPAPPAPTHVPDLLHSLSQAAVTLQGDYQPRQIHRHDSVRTPPEMSPPPSKRHGGNTESISPSIGPPLHSRARYG